MPTIHGGIHVERGASDALLRRVEQIRIAQQPGSKQRAKMQHDLEQIVFNDNADQLLRGVDRHGQPRAPLAASTLKNKRRGPGPSLIPRGRSSRFITNFVARFAPDGSELIASYVNILSKQGKPFVQYHLTGGPRLPKRDVGGVTPKGWAAIKARFGRYVAEVGAAGGESSE